MRLASLALASLALTIGSTARAQGCDDDALAEAAAELVLSHGEPSGEELLEAARRAGSDAPVVYALAIRDGDERRVAPWLARMAERLRAPIACGEAHGTAGALVLAAARAGTLALEGHDALVRVTVARGFTAPALYVEDARGEVRRLELHEGAAELPADLERPLRVQLVADGPDGPRPIAERIAGEEARTSGGQEATTRSEEAPLDARIGALRERAGALPLRPHRILATVAREHAEHVCRAGRAAHELEPGRDPRRRARERGIEARHVGEVVARGRAPGAALSALLRSPSHRAALIDPRFTDAGAGIAEDARGRACVVVLLAAWPRLVAR